VSPELAAGLVLAGFCLGAVFTLALCHLVCKDRFRL
jgi:hypothetical protein